jgi:hypothetical protein
MRKLSFSLLTAVLFMAACQKNSDKAGAATEPEAITQRNCAANEVLEAQMAADPALKNRMAEIEAFTQRAIASGETARLVNGQIVIPVIVNVLYNSAAENISLAQIQSQIDVLNQDYTKTNSDIGLTPAEFTDEATNVGIKFELAGVVRKATNKKSWGTNDAMKKSAMGGIDPTDPTHNLNMWSCNLGQGLLGYAQFPGGNQATDGVVILYSAFGSRKLCPSGTFISKYDLGRTATHEVGHWMNLRHIWGDATCGNDQVGDTPQHNAANYGCPSYPHKSTCTGTPTEMTMNYMDYTDDACMYLFSNGQRDRALAVFAAGGPRAAMAQ